MLVEFVLSLLLQAAPAVEATEPPREIAPGVHLIPGGIPEGRQPDGNSVVFDAPQGLVVVDTGRHLWHSDAILAFAEARERPIAAIVNTHWHLDHASGNRRIKTTFPRARVYASNAIDRALAGFLASSARTAQEYLDAGRLSGTIAEDVRGDIETFQRGDTLRPDVVIARSQRLRIAGKRFDVRLAANAATDGDVWLYDRASRVAVVGDLVTLPAPFLDTACPEGWRSALAEVSATPFETLIPGHGEPMTRAEFATWRTAFGAFIDCANSDTEAAACAAGWARGVGALLTPDAARTDAERRATYYVNMLRQNGGRSADCAA